MGAAAMPGNEKRRVGLSNLSNLGDGASGGAAPGGAAAGAYGQELLLLSVYFESGMRDRKRVFFLGGEGGTDGAYRDTRRTFFLKMKETS